MRTDQSEAEAGQRSRREAVLIAEHRGLAIIALGIGSISLLFIPIIAVSTPSESWIDTRGFAVIALLVLGALCPLGVLLWWTANRVSGSPQRARFLVGWLTWAAAATSLFLALNTRNQPDGLPLFFLTDYLAWGSIPVLYAVVNAPLVYPNRWGWTMSGMILSTYVLAAAVLAMKLDRASVAG